MNVNNLKEDKFSCNSISLWQSLTVCLNFNLLFFPDTKSTVSEPFLQLPQIKFKTCTDRSTVKKLANDANYQTGCYTILLYTVMSRKLASIQTINK